MKKNPDYSISANDSIISSLKKEILEKNNKISSLLEQIKKQEPLIHDYELLKSKCTSLTNDLLVIKNELEISKSNKSFLEIELEKKNTEIENYLKKVETLKSESEKLREKIETLKAEKKKKENEILKNQEKGIKFDILEEENDNLNEKIVVLNNLLVQKDKEILNLKNINDEISKTNTMLINQVNEFKKILKKKDKNYDDLSTQKKSDKALMNEVINKNMELINDNHNLKNNNNFLNDELNDAINKMTILNHQISTNSLELKENKHIIEEIKSKNEKLESVNKDFISQIQNLHTKLLAESRKNSEMTSEVCNLEKSIFDLKTIIDKNNKIISDLVKNRDEMNINNNSLKKELSEINNENNILKKEKLKLENKLKKICDENSNNGDNIYKLEQNRILLEKNIEKINKEKNEAINNIQQLKENIKQLNEQIASSKIEKKDLVCQMNEIEYQNKKNWKLEEYYENYIKKLNNQIYQLESQIETLQNKVLNISGSYKKENEYNYNLNLLKEQIVYLQKENKKLKEIINLKEYKNKNNQSFEEKPRIIINQRPMTQTIRSKLTNESDNEYVKQFINDFHKQIDELNIDSNLIINKNNQLNKNIKNVLINNNNDEYNSDDGFHENENIFDNYEYVNNGELSQNEVNYNYLNNSNDIVYQGDKKNLIYNKINSKDDEDIKINYESRNKISNEIMDVNINNKLIESMPNINKMSIDNKIKN